MHTNPIVMLLAMIFAALAFTGCEKEETTGALTQECTDIRTEPECKQCCLGAGASEYDFDKIDDDDGDLLCTCVKPAL